MPQEPMSHPFQERQRLALLIKEKLAASTLDESAFAQAADTIDLASEERLREVVNQDVDQILQSFGLPAQTRLPATQTDTVRNDVSGRPDVLSPGPHTGTTGHGSE